MKYLTVLQGAVFSYAQCVWNVLGTYFLICKQIFPEKKRVSKEMNKESNISHCERIG